MALQASLSKVPLHGRTEAPNSLKKYSKIMSKSTPEASRRPKIIKKNVSGIMLEIRLRFLTIWGSKMGAKMEPEIAQKPDFGAQGPTRGAQGPPRGLQGAIWDPF